jgi:NADPH:quinone reductase-like Zn-dependent oxidoreductase
VRFKSLCVELFELVGSGVLKTAATRTYALADAMKAHRDAEAAQHAGPVVLVP